MINATQHDIETLVKILAPPFSDNLSVNRCVKQDNKRLERIENQIRYVSNISIRNQMAFVNQAKTAALLCNLSSGKKATLMDDMFFITKVSGLKLGLELVKRERLLKQMHPCTDFCHLWFIGVDTAQQGQGMGSEMMDFIKQHCIEKQLPIYLETSNQRNIKFYEKHGFNLYEKIKLPMDDFELSFFSWEPN